MTIFGFFWLWSFEHSKAHNVPAIFMFGDSFLDVGNNRYLGAVLTRADYPPNGIDYPNHKPTGRFSNGKNTADFVCRLYISK